MVEGVVVAVVAARHLRGARGDAVLERAVVVELDVRREQPLVRRDGHLDLLLLRLLLRRRVDQREVGRAGEVDREVDLLERRHLQRRRRVRRIAPNCARIAPELRAGRHLDVELVHVGAPVARRVLLGLGVQDAAHARQLALLPVRRRRRRRRHAARLHVDDWLDRDLLPRHRLRPHRSDVPVEDERAVRAHHAALGRRRRLLRQLDVPRLCVAGARRRRRRFRRRRGLPRRRRRRRRRRCDRVHLGPLRLERRQLGVVLGEQPLPLLLPPGGHRQLLLLLLPREALLDELARVRLLELGHHLRDARRHRLRRRRVAVAERRHPRRLLRELRALGVHREELGAPAEQLRLVRRPRAAAVLAEQRHRAHRLEVLVDERRRDRRPARQPDAERVRAVEQHRPPRLHRAVGDAHDDRVELGAGAEQVEEAVAPGRRRRRRRDEAQRARHLLVERRPAAAELRHHEPEQQRRRAARLVRQLVEGGGDGGGCGHLWHF